MADPMFDFLHLIGMDRTWTFPSFLGGEATATIKPEQPGDKLKAAENTGLLPPTAADDKVRRARLMELSRLLSGHGRKSTFLTDGLPALTTTGPTTRNVGGDFGVIGLPTLGKPTTLGGGA